MPQDGQSASGQEGKYGGIATGEAFMRYVGMEYGEFRLPVKNIDRKMYDQFAEDVRALGIDELLSKK